MTVKNLSKCGCFKFKLRIDYQVSKSEITIAKRDMPLRMYTDIVSTAMSIECSQVYIRRNHM